MPLLKYSSMGLGDGVGGAGMKEKGCCCRCYTYRIKRPPLTLYQPLSLSLLLGCSRNQGTPTLFNALYIYSSSSSSFYTCRRDVGHYANNPLPSFLLFSSTPLPAASSSKSVIKCQKRISAAFKGFFL